MLWDHGPAMMWCYFIRSQFSVPQSPFSDVIYLPNYFLHFSLLYTFFSSWVFFALLCHQLVADFLQTINFSFDGAVELSLSVQNLSDPVGFIFIIVSNILSVYLSVWNSPDKSFRPFFVASTSLTRTGRYPRRISADSSSDLSAVCSPRFFVNAVIVNLGLYRLCAIFVHGNDL